MAQTISTKYCLLIYSIIVFREIMQKLELQTQPSLVRESRLIGVIRISTIAC